ncbi:MAG: YdcF family protein [Salaquimonas sp.]|nr:YdcF family protein [Salaquimonas sp.]
MSSHRRSRGPLARFANRVTRGFLFVVLIAGIAGVIGFLQFSSEITALKNAGPVEPADGIVVLTGGRARIATALGLLAQGKGKRLLISGVHPRSTPAAIRAAVGGRAELFECCVDIDHAALDTTGNAEEAGKWAHRNGFTSLIVVTSDYHMPRSLMEMRHHGPEIRFTPYFVSHDVSDDGELFDDPATLRLMASEYLKYLAAGLRLRLAPAPAKSKLASAKAD